LLEFDVIRERVADCARSGEAAGLIREAEPRYDAGEAGELKAQVAQILDRFNSGDEEPQGSLPDIGALLPKLEVEGASLDTDELYALGLFAERGEALRRWLREIAGDLPDCAPLAREVFRVLDKEGNLRDLPEFRAVKDRIAHLARELETAVARYGSSEETRRMLQSSLPSQRDGRAVLAVKANFRGRIKGIIHEVSSTGQTLFVEPEEVVEKNNDILLEKRRLDAEIRRALRELTGRAAAFLPALAEFHRGILRLECIRARARYSREIQGNFAAAGDSLRLLGARHPLLGSKAVPIDFDMDFDTKTVIITGPNTGGKTVALKTAGLLALMNQFGLALPAAEGTILPVFDGIYADIGDEQSLSQSLSTFSAHMTNIAAIAAAAGEKSLALLDELGSGTDPEEGGAIAMAILDHLIEKRCRLIITTHHGILKNYGYTRQGVENASVEFDGRTLSPTYRIVMGLPGESRAVDIAARNGLPAGIIAAARGYLDEERSDVSALIRGLKEKRRELDERGEESRAETGRLREERRRADLRELRLRRKELDIQAGDAGNFKRFLGESRKNLENLVRELREGEMSREKTLKVKEFIRGLEETAAAEDAALESAREALAEDRRRFEAAESGAAETGSPGGISPAVKIGPGTEVLAGEFRRRGAVLREGKRGMWIVEIGSLKIPMKEEDLLPLPPSAEEKKPLIIRADLSDASPPAQIELNLRGMRLDEALERLRRQIDGAVLAGLYEFAVVHGKGDGVLQKGVHDFLKTQSQVADYYFSRPELGGFGRTEVILKR
jgi:DNA mismatch repair protein MutS2